MQSLDVLLHQDSEAGLGPESSSRHAGAAGSNGCSTTPTSLTAGVSGHRQIVQCQPTAACSSPGLIQLNPIKEIVEEEYNKWVQSGIQLEQQDLLAYWSVSDK